MHARAEVPEALLRLADLQGDVVTREQALAHQLPRSSLERLARAGQWQRLASGLYFVQSSPPPWTSLAWAGVLIGGDAARLGGLAAAHLHELGDPPDRIEVLVPHAGPVPAVGEPWRFRRERPGARNPGTVGLPPRIRLADTVLDLAAATTDVAEIVDWVTKAVQTRRVSPAELRRALQARRCHPHRRLLEELLADVAAGAVTPLELRYLRRVERAHDLPIGTRQRSRRRTEVDVWYEKYATLVELDGRLGHSGMGRFKDMRRDNRSTSDGLATLRYGHSDVYGDQCAVAFEVGHNISIRGWNGLLTRCRYCRRVL